MAGEWNCPRYSLKLVLYWSSFLASWGSFWLILFVKSKSKSIGYELASLVFFQKQKPSIVKIIEQPVFLKAVFQAGNKRTFIVSLVDTR